MTPQDLALIALGAGDGLTWVVDEDGEIARRVEMKCPTCGNGLHRVSGSVWMNSDQFDAVKAGDWYCETCPDNGRGNSGLCYWWDREVEAHNRRQCEAMTRT